jgi:uncharacterized membrane protein required for colicin V production
MAFTTLDGVLVLVFGGVCMLALIQGFIRTWMTLFAFYLATVVAGLAYPYAARYVTAIGGRYPSLTETVMFWVLFAVVSIVIEVATRRGFPDVRLLALKVFDNFLAILPGIVCGIIVASLLLSSLGHSTRQMWGDGDSPGRGTLYRAYLGASLGPALRTALDLYLLVHPWFVRPPPLMAPTTS